MLPTFAAIVGSGWVSQMGTFDLAKLVHGEQEVRLHRPLPASGSLEATSEIVGIYDKGKAAVVTVETRSVLAGTGDPLCTTRMTLFIRGEGGWGGDSGPPSRGSARPEREADETVTYGVPVDQALVYRLSGDRNPLHSDPAFAKRAGFERPILHGLCTFGYTGRAVLHAAFGSDVARFQSFSGRFKAPVLPGDTLTVRLWRDGAQVTCETCSQDGTVVLTGSASGAERD